MAKSESYPLKMEELNLPNYKIRLEHFEGVLKVFDIIRKKFIIMTPEEWVRQHFINYLINHLKYPKSLIKVESGHKFNKLAKRSDIIVYDRTGSPFMLVECKSSKEKIKKAAAFQASVYNRTIKSRYVVVTNGMGFICGSVESSNRNINWMEHLPPFP